MSLPYSKPPTAQEEIDEAADLALEYLNDPKSTKWVRFFATATMHSADRFRKFAAADDWRAAASAAYTVGRDIGQMFMHVVRSEPGKKGREFRDAARQRACAAVGAFADKLAARDSRLTIKEVLRRLPEAMRLEFRSANALSRAIREHSAWGRNRYGRRRIKNRR